jgi:hypothetical protein
VTTSDPAQTPGCCGCALLDQIWRQLWPGNTTGARASARLWQVCHDFGQPLRAGAKDPVVLGDNATGVAMVMAEVSMIIGEGSQAGRHLRPAARERDGHQVGGKTSGNGAITLPRWPRPPRRAPVSITGGKHSVIP